MVLDQRDPHDHAVMSFGDHLEELRKRILLALALPIPVAILVFCFAQYVRDFICAPAIAAQKANGLPGQMQALSPGEVLSTDLWLSVVVAAVVSAPWILWQVWKFVEPGLYASERRFVRLLVPGSAALMLMGMAMLHWVVMPLMLRVLVGFGVPSPKLYTPPPAVSPSDPGAPDPHASAPMTFPQLDVPPEHPVIGQAWLNAAHELVVACPGSRPGSVELRVVPMMVEGAVGQQFRLSEYVDLVLMLMLGMAIAFQLPLVVLLLGWIGIVDIPLLRKYRRHAIMGCLILAAIITPEPISMLLMAGPLYLLYELGIWLLIVAPPSAVAEGKVLRRMRDVLLGRGRVAS